MMGSAFWLLSGIAAAADVETPAAVERALAEHPELAAGCGEATVELTLEADGSASWEPESEAERCVASALEGFVFPNPDGEELSLLVQHVPGAGLSLTGPVILRAMDRSTIDQVVHRKLGAIRYCYQRSLIDEPALEGKVVITFVIGSDGRVLEAGVKPVSTTMPDPRVGQCVAERFRKLRFPDPKGGGIVIVSYPFLFTPG